MGSRPVAVVLLGLAMGACGTTGAPLTPFAGAERYFRIEWQPAQSPRHGRVVQGSVYNTYGHTAGGVRLLVEGLDASGQVTSRTIGYVLDEIPTAVSTIFEVPVPAAASYQVYIFAFEWRGRGP